MKFFCRAQQYEWSINKASRSRVGELTPATRSVWQLLKICLIPAAASEAVLWLQVTSFALLGLMLMSRRNYYSSWLVRVGLDLLCRITRFTYFLETTATFCQRERSECNFTAVCLVPTSELLTLWLCAVRVLFSLGISRVNLRDRIFVCQKTLSRQMSL